MTAPVFHDPAATPLMTQAAFAYACVRAIELLKKSPWFPWLHMQTARANKIAALLFAAASSLGVHAIWSYDPKTGNFGLNITGLTLAAGLGIAWSIYKSYFLQQVFFQATVRYPGNGAPPAAPAVDTPAKKE